MAQLGSISWFVPTLMDESERLKKKIQPPSSADWNNQMYRMRVFSSLVRDTDRNLTNVLVAPDWKVIMIDFSRAFRLQPNCAPGRISRKSIAGCWPGSSRWTAMPSRRRPRIS